MIKCFFKNLLNMEIEQDRKFDDLVKVRATYKRRRFWMLYDNTLLRDTCNVSLPGAGMRTMKLFDRY